MVLGFLRILLKKPPITCEQKSYGNLHKVWDKKPKTIPKNAKNEKNNQKFQIFLGKNLKIFWDMGSLKISEIPLKRIPERKTNPTFCSCTDFKTINLKFSGHF